MMISPQEYYREYEYILELKEDDEWWSDILLHLKVLNTTE